MNDEDKFRLVRFKVAEIELARIWNMFEAEGLHPVLIKGWAAARYYDDPSSRPLGDIDLAFSPAEYARAVGFRDTEKLMRTDLHSSLRHLDTAPWEELFERTVTVKCETASIRVLSDEDHLRVIAVHWLTDGGAYLDKLRDIAWIVLRSRDSFDWDACFAATTPLRVRWIRTVVALAHRYGYADLSFVPFADRFKDVPDWVVAEVERERASGYRLVPLHFVLSDTRELWRQIRKRLRPNLLQATIETESPIGERPRRFVRLRNFLIRIGPSVSRVFPAVRREIRRRRG